MEKNPGVKYAYGWNRLNMNLMGIWPKVNSTGIWKYSALLNAVSIFLFLTLPRLAALFFFWGETDAMIQCFATHMPYAIGIFKLLILHFRQQVLGEFLQTMENDWTISMSKEELEIMMKMARIGRGISIISGSMAHSANTIGAVVQKWYNLENMYIKNPDPRLTTNLFWIIYVPFNTSKTTNYAVSLILQCYTSCTGALIYFVFDSFMVMMILHLCGQLGLVEMSLCQLKDNNILKKSWTFQDELRNIVQKHEKLIELANKLEESFNSVLLLSLVGSSLTFCFEGYALIKLLGEGELNFFQLCFSLTVVFAAILHFFFCCWAGDFLITQSIAVGRAVYDSMWYTLPICEARSLMLIGFKKFRPLELTAGKFAALSLNIFLNVMKTSMSYLSVLLAMQKRRV